LFSDRPVQAEVFFGVCFSCWMLDVAYWCDLLPRMR